MPPKNKSASSEGATKTKRRRVLDKESDEYLLRRERNNIAVKKSREKSRAKAKGTVEKVAKLKAENASLEQQVTILSKELGVLKDLFKMVHSGTDEDGGINFAAIGSKTESAAEPVGTTQQTQETSQDTVALYDSNVKPKSIVRRVSTVNTDALQKDHEYFSTKR